MLGICCSIGCTNYTASSKDDFCPECYSRNNVQPEPQEAESAYENSNTSLAEKYPKYYKSVKGMTEVDVYAVHYLFDIQDPSGAIQHASKKLLLSGVRTGGKSKYDDIREARDTLTRWLELNAKSQ